MTKGKTICDFKDNCEYCRIRVRLVENRKQKKEKWIDEFKNTFAEYAEHKRLREPAYMVWVIDFIKNLLDKEREEAYQKGIKEAPESIGQYDEGYAAGRASTDNYLKK